VKLTPTIAASKAEARAYNATTRSRASIHRAPIGKSQLTIGTRTKTNERGDKTGTMKRLRVRCRHPALDDEDRLVSVELATTITWSAKPGICHSSGDWNSVTEIRPATQSTHHGPRRTNCSPPQAKRSRATPRATKPQCPAVLRVSPLSPSPSSLLSQWDFEKQADSADTDNDAVADVTTNGRLGRELDETDGTTNTGIRAVRHQTDRRYNLGHRKRPANVTTTPTPATSTNPVMRAGTAGNRYYHRAKTVQCGWD